MTLWLDEVHEKMKELLTLAPNWDSYGAKPVRRACVEYALNHLLSQCVQETTPAPSIVPLNKGGIMLEWHCRQIDLEVRVDEPERVSLYFADSKDGTEQEFELNGNLLPLKVALSKLTQRG